VPVIPPPPREYETSEPTCVSTWPLTGLAGVDHAGKTYLAAQASGSDLIGQTFFISFGEGEANAYGRVPGARYRIVRLPDGSYRTLLGAVLWATRQPRVTPEKPNLIILDGGTKLYHMLQEEQQLVAYLRAVKKAKDKGWREPDPDTLRISNDGWNAVKERWAAVIDPLKEHDGPVIVTVLLEDLMVVDGRGEPTKDRTWKWQAHKTLQSRCDDTLEIRDRQTRDVLVTGTRSLVWQPTEGEVDGRLISDFSFDRYWRALGLDKAPVSQPTVHQPDPGAYVAEVAEQTARDVAANEQAAGRREAAEQGNLPSPDRLMHEIKEAMDSPDPRRALLALRSGYGASALEAVEVKLLSGNASGNAAISIALDKVAEAATTVEAPAAQTAAEPAAAPQAGRPRRRTQIDALREELELQAYLAGQAADVYAGDILKKAGATVAELAQQHFRMVGAWVAMKRPQAIAALEAAGHAAAAEAYRKAPLDDTLPQELYDQIVSTEVDAAPMPAPEPVNA
jgi:hypothetical protein